MAHSRQTSQTSAVTDCREEREWRPLERSAGAFQRDLTARPAVDALEFHAPGRSERHGAADLILPPEHDNGTRICRQPSGRGGSSGRSCADVEQYGVGGRCRSSPCPTFIRRLRVGAWRCGRLHRHATTRRLRRLAEKAGVRNTPDAPSRAQAHICHDRARRRG